MRKALIKTNWSHCDFIIRKYLNKNKRRKAKKHTDPLDYLVENQVELIN